MSRLIDLTGKYFGTLEVLSQAPSAKLPPHGQRRHRGLTMWCCRCRCGREVVCRGDKLRQNAQRSCGRRGCARSALSLVAARERNVWLGLKERCYNKNSHSYVRYGKRGITMCPQWKNSFEQFLSDMGPRPSSKHSIDRFPNNDGNYEPGNCRWATKKEQQRNTRLTVFVDFQGERVPLITLSERYGISRGVVKNRLLRGWALEDAILIPVKGQK
jgi:hypothetical protein